MDSVTLNNATRLLIESFALGDMLQDAQHKNLVIDEYIDIIEATQIVPADQTIDLLCNTVHQDSTLMRLAVDYAAFDMSSVTFDESVEVYPIDFVKKIAKACVQDKHMHWEEKAPHVRERCYYHDHPDGEGRTTSCSEPSR